MNAKILVAALVMVGAFACAGPDLTLPDDYGQQNEPPDAATVKHRPDAGADAGADAGGDAGPKLDAGTSDAGVDAGPGADLTPPAFGGVTAVTAKSDTSIEIAWAPGTDDRTPAAGITYLVYFATSTPVDTRGAPDKTFVGSTTTSWTVTGLAPGTRYFARVKAKDEVGNLDVNTKELSALTPDATPPSVPTNLLAFNSGPTAITVTWTASTDNGTPPGAINYVTAIAEQAADLATAPTFATASGVTNYKFTGLKPGTTYFMNVRAQDAQGNKSAPTQPVTLATPFDTTAPNFAGLGQVVTVDPQTVRLNWPAATDDATPATRIVYGIWQASTSGGEALGSAPTATVTGATTLDVKSLAPSTTYYFVVRATDEAGNADQNQVEKSGKTADDVNPPSFGGLTSAVVKSPTELTLTWTAATDNVTPSAAIVYDVYYSTGTNAVTYTTPNVTTPAGVTSYVLSGLQPTTKYNVVVRARDAAGKQDVNTVTKSATTPAVPDTTKPVFGGIVGLTAPSPTSIRATWNPGSDDVTAAASLTYKLYVLAWTSQTPPAAADVTAVTPQTIVGSSACTQTSGPQCAMTIGSRQSNTHYYVIVRAFDAAGNDDGNTTQGDVITPLPADTTPPTFAGLSSATTFSTTEVDLSWTAATDDRDPSGANIVYRVFWATTSGGQNFGQPAQKEVTGVTSTRVSGLTAATTYYFVVRAVDAAGNSDINTVQKSAMTQNIPDTTAPTFAGVTGGRAKSSTEAALTWSAATDNVVGPITYNVYSGSSASTVDFTTPVLATPAGAVSAVLTGLTPSTTYFFAVRAKDSAGNEDTNTATVSVTTYRTPTVSFATQIEPIFNTTLPEGQKCASCHGGASPTMGMSLETGSAYNSLVGASGLGTSSVLNPSMKRVLPGNPAQSLMYLKVTNDTAKTGGSMPYGGTDLKTQDVTKTDLIKAWIEEGALNN